MKINVTEFLKNVFLFRSFSEQDFVSAVKSLSYECKSYAKGEVIYSPNEYSKKIGFVLSGECTAVRAKGENIGVPLNSIGVGASFGIVAAFSKNEEFPTEIIAKKSSEILFIPQSEILRLTENYHRASLNIIEFLTGKIEFLNKKIATFSSDCVEDKLASYLLMKSEKLGPSFPFNCKMGAEFINAGRASLYRALASLSEQNLVKLENKKIYILDRIGLERKTK